MFLLFGVFRVWVFWGLGLFGACMVIETSFLLGLLLRRQVMIMMMAMMITL